MERAMVIGCPGSGKSTFARALREKTGLPLVYMDRLFWNADKTCVPKETLLLRVRQAAARERWIIDGNYQSTLDIRLRACDTVFFLDYPLDVCLQGAQSRRGRPREDMPWIEPAGDIDPEFRDYILGFHKEQRPQIRRLLAQYADKRAVVFRSRAEAARYLETL